MRNYNVSKFIYTYTTHILCITQHHHTLLIFVILIFIASAVQNILPFFAMKGAHIFMGSGADAKHNITVSARHGVYTHTETGNIFSFSFIFRIFMKISCELIILLFYNLNYMLYDGTFSVPEP